MFFMNLCASRENEIVYLEIGNLINTPTLTEEESNSLEGLITKQEAHSALKQMKNNEVLVQTATQLSFSKCSL